MMSAAQWQDLQASFKVIIFLACHRSSCFGRLVLNILMLGLGLGSCTADMARVVSQYSLDHSRPKTAKQRGSDLGAPSQSLKTL